MKKKLAALISAVLALCLLLPPVGAAAAGFPVSFSTSCAAIEMVNLDTGTVVYQKNPDVRREPASTTKIMTYIVAVEHIKDLQGTRIPVTKKVMNELLGTGSSMSGIKVGDVLTAFQLLNCMMVPSGNDAALVLADYVGGGSAEKFVAMMNQKAKQLGCTGTHFANPHGLHDPNHYTTASDLTKIARYAMKLPYFMEICSQVGYSYAPVGGPDANKKIPHPLSTTNLLLNKNAPGNTYYYQYARGIKTGHTDEAGYCLVSTATADGYSYLCVALGAPSLDKQGRQIQTRGEMADSAKLYRWALTSLELKKIVGADDPVQEVKLNYAWNKDTLLLKPEKSYSALLPKEVSPSSVIVTKNTPKSVDAPVREGQPVGTATFSYANQKLATVKLVAAESVERSELLHTTDMVRVLVTSPWFVLVVAIILVLLAVYIVLAVLYNRRRKKLRKVKRYRRM